MQAAINCHCRKNFFSKKVHQAPTEMSQQTQIQRFFDGKSIFVTGGTGFIGSLLIEKLLRCCPNIVKIYVLVREKWGVDPRQRFQEFFKCTIFDQIKTSGADRLKKVILVEGNLETEKLGLSVKDWNAIVENVECIFHLGAVVTFVGKLREVLRPNVFGTAEIVRLAKEVKNLKCLVYVSSTYSQCTKAVVEEKLYESDVAAEDLLLLHQNLGSKLDEVESVFLGTFPNTYTYSKFLSEDFLRRNALDIPVGIVRPSIVCQTWKEPVPGWADPQNSIAKLLALYAIGMIHVVPSNTNDVVDIVPADYVINSVIATAWEVGTSWNNKKIDEPPQVFNCSSSHHNPITSTQAFRYLLKYFHEYPTNHGIWSPYIVVNSHGFYRQLFYYFQLPQIIVLDAVNYIFGKPMIFWKLYKKASTRLSVKVHFLINTWVFKADNTKRLWKKLEEQDQKLFNFDVESIRWSSVLSSYVRGVRKYILQDGEDTLPKAQKRLCILKTLHYSVVFCTILIVLMILRLFFHFIYDLVWQ